MSFYMSGRQMTLRLQNNGNDGTALLNFSSTTSKAQSMTVREPRGFRSSL
jgi:hypothetical protein